MIDATNWRISEKTAIGKNGGFTIDCGCRGCSSMKSEDDSSHDATAFAFKTTAVDELSTITSSSST